MSVTRLFSEGGNVECMFFIKWDYCLLCLGWQCDFPLGILL